MHLHQIIGILTARMVLSVYLELFGVPIAIFGWVLYSLLIKGKKWMTVKPDFQVSAFVCFVWYIVYFVLLRG